MKRLLACTLAVLALNALAEELPVFKLEVRDGVFAPTRLEVPAGTKFKIELHNTGSSAIEFESKPLRKEKVLGPGAQSFVVIHGLEPGEYPFFDEFHQDIGQGVIVAR
ncbi:MAG TPA: cupredoxin domain-containing protein [Candidatus Competibacteraceae bacterium]|nr:cupredoxin domain-containing protein [Candidatus Competibacteraceae bacterium]